jgi:hypothetical protein
MTLRCTLRLFAARLALLTFVAILESWIGGLQPFLQLLFGLYLMVGMIVIRAVVLSGYSLTVFGTAIYAPVKVLQTEGGRGVNSSTRRTQIVDVVATNRAYAHT